MQYKTSTKISLKFTLFSSILLLLFGFFVNFLFFWSWYYIQNQRLNSQISIVIPWILSFWGKQGRNIIKTDSIDSEIAQNIGKNIFFLNISKIDDIHYLFLTTTNQITFIDISQEIESQKNLLFISLYVIIVFSILNYFVSRWFVVSSLKWLKTLSKFVEWLHFDNLKQKIDFPGHEKDELKIIANWINEAIFRLSEQADALKDFVRNASHELKTPLMMINSEADLAIKSQKYVSGLKNIKNYLKQLDNLIEHLLLITKLDSGVVFWKEEIDIIPIIQKHIDVLKEQYKDKEISISKNIPLSFIYKAHEWVFNIIIRNLLDNAFKYTSKWGSINIVLEKKSFL